MSFLSGTQMEVLYAMPAPGAALANSTTNTAISGNSSTNPPYQMPNWNTIWGSASYMPGRLLRFCARGTVGTTGTPTLKVGVYLDTTQNTQGTILAGTGAFTTASSLTSAVWELEFDVEITSVGTGSNMTITSAGVFTIGNSANAATAAGVAYMVGAPAVTSFADNVSYFPEVWALWGTASASNTITCTQFMVCGLN